jgi:hypothetical protein
MRFKSTHGVKYQTAHGVLHVHHGTMDCDGKTQLAFVLIIEDLAGKVIHQIPLSEEAAWSLCALIPLSAGTAALAPMQHEFSLEKPV